MTLILAQNTASITELKINPMQVMEEAEGAPVAVLNRNKPAFYCVPPELYEQMLDKLEDIELAEIVRERAGEPSVEVSIDGLLSSNPFTAQSKGKPRRKRASPRGRGNEA